MGRKARMRKLLRDEDEEELLRDPKLAEADEAKAGAKPQQQPDDPVARTLDLQKPAGNRAVGAALARWPLFAAPQPVAQWPKHLEMVLDGKVVIPLESAQLGTSRQLTSTSANREKPVQESGEMVVTLRQGEWSTDLFHESLSGRGYTTVEVVFPGKDGKGLRVILADVVIANYSVGAGGSDGPLETLALNFKKREFSEDPPPARR